MQAVRRILVAAFLLAACLAPAQTTSNNFYPSSTGLNLGNYNQQWNLQGQDVNLYRNFRLWNAQNSKHMLFQTNFSTSVVSCIREDGTRCTFDGGGATTSGLNDCGVWDPATVYPAKCVVQYNSSSWVAILTSSSIPPGTNALYWRVFAQAGANGANGINGTNGAPGTPGYNPNQLLSGGGVAWISDYNYTVSAASYTIQNVAYNSPQSTVTLAAADLTLDRCDTLYVNTSSTVAAITGTPAAQPACPVADPATQLTLTYLLVSANTTQPTTVVQTDIYHENTEWTMTRTGTPINLASTVNPHAGTKDIEATSAVTGNFFNAANPSGTLDLATRNNLIFWISSKAPWVSTRSITIQWYNGTTAKCTPITFGNGTFGFNSSTTSYQQIVIPLSVFSCGGIPVTALRFTIAGSGTNLGWYIDDIILQGGIPPTAGSLAMVWRGTWNNTFSYAVNDTVYDSTNKATWVAVVSNISSEPSDSNTAWQRANFPGPPFISDSANPAATGIVRLANNSDKVSWRNAANGGDEGIYFNSSDQFVIEGAGSASEIDMVTEASASATTPASSHGTVFVDSSSSLVCTKDSGGTVHCPGSGSGSVTSIATTSPITGGTITTTGTIACATCVVASSPGAGVAHFAGSTQTVTSSTIATADIAANAVTSAKEAVVNTRRTCMLQVGDGTNTVVSGDYSPFKVSACYVPYAATIVEINIQADAGTPSVLLERRRGSATLADLLSGALASAGTTHTCAMASTGQTCIDGTTSSGSITLSNTSLNAGDVIEVKSGTASTETSMRIAIVWTVN